MVIFHFWRFWPRRLACATCGGGCKHSWPLFSLIFFFLLFQNSLILAICVHLYRNWDKNVGEVHKYLLYPHIVYLYIDTFKHSPKYKLQTHVLQFFHAKNTYWIIWEYLFITLPLGSNFGPGGLCAPLVVMDGSEAGHCFHLLFSPFNFYAFCLSPTSGILRKLIFLLALIFWYN